MIEKDLLIIGSGPAGLRAGEEAKKSGLDYLILEKGDVAQSWRDIRQDMLMLSPCLPQRDWTSISKTFPIWKMDVTRPFCYAHEFLDYLIKYSEEFDLNIETKNHIISIVRNNDFFKVKTNNNKNYKAKLLVMATGFFGNPHLPEIPGLHENPIVIHSHQIKTVDPFRNKRVVIIGSGNSAAEIAIILAGYAQVYLLTRDKLKFFSETKNLCNIRGISESFLLELIEMEIIRYIPEVDIQKVDGNIIYLTDKTIEAQAIICATGYYSDLSALGSTKINIDKRTSFPKIDSNGQSNTIKNLFFVGPLAFTGINSLLIHGFIKMIPKTITEMTKRLVVDSV